MDKFVKALWRNTKMIISILAGVLILVGGFLGAIALGLFLLHTVGLPATFLISIIMVIVILSLVDMFQ